LEIFHIKFWRNSTAKLLHHLHGINFYRHIFPLSLVWNFCLHFCREVFVFGLCFSVSVYHELINCLYVTRTSLFHRTSLDFGQRILTKMARYSRKLMQWPQGKDVHHHNSHWHGFIIREVTFAPYLAHQK
jgi:hypothetical protein